MTVVEIGPGPGGLTRALLLEGARRVVAIERDERCLPALAEIAAHYPGRLEIVSRRCAEMDYRALALPSPARIVANLPYNIGTPLLISWLKTEPWPPWFDRLVLMFQREVAERIVAAPRTKDYGRLAVLAQWRTKPRILFTLPAEAFTPRPRSTSALVEFVPEDTPEPPCDVEQWRRSRRRPSARGARCSAPRSASSPLTARRLLESLGIAPTARAEELDVAEFCRIANASAARLELGEQVLDEALEPGEPRAAQALGGEDRAHGSDRLLDVVVDHHVVVLVPMLDLVARAAHAPLHDISGGPRRAR